MERQAGLCQTRAVYLREWETNVSIFIVHSQGLDTVWWKGSKPDIMGAHAVKKEFKKKQMWVYSLFTHKYSDWVPFDAKGRSQILWVRTLWKKSLRRNKCESIHCSLTSPQTGCRLMQRVEARYYGRARCEKKRLIKVWCRDITLTVCSCLVKKLK